MAELTREKIDQIDSEGMWELMRAFPKQWDEAVDFTKGFDPDIDRSNVQNICFAGMGGSAIGADLIRAYTYHTATVPVQVIRHYEIPSWVNEKTLFIGCSFSGNTEETLSALEQAKEQGAQLMGITSGGTLLVQATEEEFDYIRIPGGMPPRAALAYSFVPLFRIFQWLGFVDEGDSALEETAIYLHEQIEKYTNFEDNEALTLASEIQDSLPIIYSDATHLEPVNLRWRGQFEENAKTLAYGNSLPEMNHNEIVGWEQIAHLTGRLSVIILRDEKDNERVQRRIDITRELIDDQVVSINELQTRGNSRLTRMFSLIQMADWTSLYLTLLNEVDPTPIAKIDLLKSKLAEV